MESLQNFKDPTSLKDKVYGILKMEIILGRFKAGDQLNILELSNTLNISGAPIREALSMLSQDGFVVLTPRKKAIVSNVSLEDYHIVMELRMMLEPYAAKLSLGHVPLQDIQMMQRQLDAVLQNPDDMYAYVASDLTLHEMLHIHAGSPVLSDILSTVKEHSLRIRYCNEEMAEADMKRESVVIATLEHKDILAAMENGTPEELYQCVRHHLGNYMQRSGMDEGIIETFIRGGKRESAKKASAK